MTSLAELIQTFQKGVLSHEAFFAQIDHPNLVSIEDKGVVDGIPYLVMSYAGQETLQKRLQQGALAREEALRIFVQAARGVQALHEHSLVHFDLKPANIFLKGDVARVGDYGLSKLVSESRNSLSFGRGTSGCQIAFGERRCLLMDGGGKLTAHRFAENSQPRVAIELLANCCKPGLRIVALAHGARPTAHMASSRDGFNRRETSRAGAAA